MRNSLISNSKLARFGRPAMVAAVLALAASASFAGAVVNVTSFIVSASGPTDQNPLAPQTYATAGTTPSSTLTVDATNGGASGSASDVYLGTWGDGPNIKAQTSAALATGNVISFTNALTGLQTGGFNLSASAMGFSSAAAGPWSMARGAGDISGAFSLLDENGDAIAGSLTFDIFFDLAVSTAANASALNSSSLASLLFNAADEDTFTSQSEFLLTSAMNPDATKSGQFTWTFDLAAGEVVNFALVGEVEANAVPEPTSLALAMFGLMAAGASCRRMRAQA